MELLVLVAALRDTHKKHRIPHRSPAEAVGLDVDTCMQQVLSACFVHLHVGHEYALRAINAQEVPIILQEAAPTWRLAEGGITVMGWNQVAGIVRLPQIRRSQQHRQQHGSHGQAQREDSTTRSTPYSCRVSSGRNCPDESQSHVSLRSTRP